jgi:hypothetical protein
MGNQTVTSKPNKPVAQSELDKFRLFYEFVADDTSSLSILLAFLVRIASVAQSGLQTQPNKK